MTTVLDWPENWVEKTVSLPDILPTYMYAMPYRCRFGDNAASLSAPATVVQGSSHYSPRLMLQAGDDPCILIRQRLSRVTGTRLGKHMEEWTVGIGQNENPLFT
jgi:hypothetical protein